MSETRVNDLVSDKVCSGLLGSPTSSRTLVVDISEQSRHVRILSVGPVGSQTKSVGPYSGIWKLTRHDTTRPMIIIFLVRNLVCIYLFISHSGATTLC